MLRSHDLDISGAGIATDTDRYLDLRFEDWKNAEAAWKDEIEETPKLYEVVLEWCP